MAPFNISPRMIEHRSQRRPLFIIKGGENGPNHVMGELWDVTMARAAYEAAVEHYPAYPWFLLHWGSRVIAEHPEPAPQPPVGAKGPTPPRGEPTR